MCKYSDKTLFVLATCLLIIFLAGCSTQNNASKPLNSSEAAPVQADATPKQVLEGVNKIAPSSVQTDVYLPPKEIKPYFNGDRTKKLIALTFDDGPDKKNTPAILDILKKMHVKATFFLIGKQIVHFPEAAKRIVDEGHSVGNHTYNHVMLTNERPKQIETELIGTQIALYNATGAHSNLFRPPFGHTSKEVFKQVSSMGFKEILWDVDPDDWRKPAIVKMVNYEINHVRNGSIILNHSGEGEKLEATIKSLPWIITVLRSKGYEFVTIPELLDARR